MESGASGLARSCSQEMLIGSSLPNFSPEIGPIVNLMDNFSLTEAASHRLYPQLKNMPLLTMNGKK